MTLGDLLPMMGFPAAIALTLWVIVRSSRSPAPQSDAALRRRVQGRARADAEQVLTAKLIRQTRREIDPELYGAPR